MVKTINFNATLPQMRMFQGTPKIVRTDDEATNKGIAAAMVSLKLAQKQYVKNPHLDIGELDLAKRRIENAVVRISQGIQK